MGAAHSATVYDPREFHYRARQLTELWKGGKIYEYRRDSQSFIKECRDAILKQPSTAPLSWNWIKCLHDLVVVHHRRGDSKNEILVADENLLLSLYTQYSPADTDLNYYLHKK